MKHVESKLFNQNGHFYYIYIYLHVQQFIIMASIMAQKRSVFVKCFKD